MPNQSTRDTTNGDIRLYPTPDGGRLIFVNGQPEMDGTLENSIYISLFVSDNWLNSISSRFEQTRSTIHQTMNRSKLTNQGRLDIMASARSALSWLTESGIASAIEVDARITGVGKMELIVTVEQPNAPRQILRYQLNWEQQRIVSGEGRTVTRI